MSFLDWFADNLAFYGIYISLWILNILLIFCFIWIYLPQLNNFVQIANNYQAILLPQAHFASKPLLTAQQCGSLAPTLPKINFKINEIEELTKQAKTIVKRNIISEEENQIRTRVNKLQGSVGGQPRKRTIVDNGKNAGKTVEETIADIPQPDANKKMKKRERTRTVNSEEIEPAWKKNWLKKQMEKEKKVEEVAPSPQPSPREGKEKSKESVVISHKTTKIKPTQDTVDTEIRRVE